MIEFEKLSESSRREILKSILKGTAAVSVALLYPLPGFSSQWDKEKDGQGEKKETNYVYIVDISRCIGCGRCVEACCVENKVPADFFRTWVERYLITIGNNVYTDSPGGGRNGFQERKLPEEINKGFFVPKLCNHCDHTPCIQVCPVAASYKSPENFVLVDKKRCIGCGYCVQACPYGSRYLSPVDHVADKCTWCYHRIKKGLRNACVQACPRKARIFGDLNDSSSEVSQVMKRENLMVLKPNLLTHPRTLYNHLSAEVV